MLSYSVQARVPRPCWYPPTRISLSTRSGRRTAYATAAAAPCEIPSRENFPGRRRRRRATDPDPVADAEPGELPLGQAAAPPVVADQRVVGRHCGEPVPPDRALRVVAEVGHPVRRLRSPHVSRH